MTEGVCNRGVSFVVRIFEAAHGFVGKHHAPAESTVSAMTLDYSDVPEGISLFGEDREIESSGRAAKANNLHRFVPRRRGELFLMRRHDIMRAIPAKPD